MIKVTVRKVGLLVCALVNWKLAAIGLLALILIGERGQQVGLIPFPPGFRIIPEYGVLALGIWAIYSLPYIPFEVRVVSIPF